MEQIVTMLRGLPGVLELAPERGSEFPEIAWGDHFFYFSPDGTVPNNRQPYATIVTKDYPDDVLSRLEAPDRWRVNIHVGGARFEALLGFPPGAAHLDDRDFSEVDVILPHPLYAAQGWVAVVNPGPRTMPRVLEELRLAHQADRRRVERRAR
jgi:hypothetical protein